MEQRGRVNCYTCKECNHRHYTLNLCTGTTPFQIMCRNCKKALAYSSFYSLPDRPLVEYVWYRPTKTHFQTMDEETQKHTLRGGLIMEELSKIDLYLDLDIPVDISSEEWGKIAFKEYVN